MSGIQFDNIYAFQFTYPDDIVILDVIDGDADDYDLNIDHSGSMILAYSFGGDFIPGRFEKYLIAAVAHIKYFKFACNVGTASQEPLPVDYGLLPDSGLIFLTPRILSQPLRTRTLLKSFFTRKS